MDTDYQYFIASPYFGEKESEEDRKKFVSVFATLKNEIKEFLSSPETAAKIYEVGQKYDLRDREISQIARIIRGLFLGTVSISDLDYISQKLGINGSGLKGVIDETLRSAAPTVINELKIIQKNKISKPQPSQRPKESVQKEDINPNNVVNLRNK